MTLAIGKENKGHEYEYKYIRPSEIKIDALYQRELNQKKVDRIIKEWDYDLVNEPKVSLRKDGSYYVFNGQHTLAAHMVHEGANTPIICKAYRGLTWEEEKELFIRQNGISSDPTTFEKLRALFNAGDKDVRDMVEGAAEAGVQITFKTQGDAYARCIAYSAVMTMYKTLARKEYVTALQTISAAWGGQKESYQEGFIKGMTQVFKKYGGQFKPVDLRKALEKNTPSYYIREAKELNGGIGQRYAKLFVREYNKKRSSGRLGE